VAVNGHTQWVARSTIQGHPIHVLTFQFVSLHEQDTPTSLLSTG